MTDTQPTDRGQVGIGTLIVFIAMVLVAAIAAGVLINTAGFLQTQAEATGEESTAQVSDNIEVVSSIGETFNGLDLENDDFADPDEPEDNDIVRAGITVQKSAGSGDIDLSDATIQYLADDATTLTHVDVDVDDDGLPDEEIDGGEESNVFFTDDVGGESDNDDVLSADDDRIEIGILLGEYDDEENDGADFVVDNEDNLEQPDVLQEGDDAELTISLAQGSQKIITLSAPDIIDDDDDPAVRL